LTRLRRNVERSSNLGSGPAVEKRRDGMGENKNGGIREEIRRERLF